MLKNYAASLRHVLLFEGGYVNHPRDPGGPTNKGVTQRVYDAWRLQHGQRKQSVRRITPDEVMSIYMGQYWTPVRGSVLRGGVDLCTFDGAVNSGVRQASLWLQRAVHTPADGSVGLLTLAACEDADPTATIHSMCNQRLAMLRRLKTWNTFGKGWTRRVEATRKASLALVDADLDPLAPGDDPAEGYA